MKKKAEAVMIVAETQKGRALHSGTDLSNYQSKLTYYNYLREAIDLMRSARTLYNS